MRAAQVLQRCLSDAVVPMHAGRRQALFKATEALLQGRRLTLMDMARSWPDAQRVRAPLKALDRLLGNRHLQGERLSLHAAMAVWLLRQPQPVIVVDWCDLKADRSQHLLRAAIAVGGRTLTLLDAVFPDGMQGSPAAEKRFLKQLAELIPAGCTPILVTDAGFRAPWFRQVEALGWHWLGRLRHSTLIKPVTEEQPEDWVPSKALYALALAAPRDLGLMHIVRNAPMVARTVLHARQPRHRTSCTRRGQPRRSKNSLQSAAREREPWLLVASPQLEALSARQLIGLYARRMQIELAFRDLKSHRYGQGFEDSLTRKGSRIEILLLIQTLAAFASWLVGIACEKVGIDRWLNPRRSIRRLYSVMRLGREALVRRWLDWTVEQLLAQLLDPHPALREQWELPA
jgi:DDE family transposase